MIYRFFSLFLLSMLLISGTTSAFERNVLIEDFWAQDVPSSAYCWPVLRDWYSSAPQLNNTVILHYHEYSPNDPWASYSNDHAIRTNFYGIGGWPVCVLDGIELYYSSDIERIDENYYSRSAISSSLNIIVNSFVDEDQIRIKLLVMGGDEDVEGDLKLHCGLLSNHLETDIFPLNNDQEEFEYDVLEFLPDAEGISIEVAANSCHEYVYTLDWPIVLAANDATLELSQEDITVFAFVQDDLDHEMINSAWSELGNAPYFISVEEESFLINRNDTVSFDMLLENFGSEAFQADFMFDIQLPQEWEFEFTTPDGSQSDDYTFVLDSNSSFTSEVSISTSNNMLYPDGNITISYCSQEFPDIIISKSFYIVMCDEVLLINSVPGETFEGIYANAFANLISVDDYDLSCWDKNKAELDYEEVFDVSPEIIIWSSGGSHGLEDSEVSFLEEYLNNGGKLWLNGSCVPYDIRYSTLIDMMGTAYRDFFEGAELLTGVEDDPYFNGIGSTVRGGDGVDNANIPSILHLSGGEACLHFEQFRWCGVRNETETYKTILFSFPFEAISDEDSRIDVMVGAMNYLIGTNDVREINPNTVPQSFVMEQNYPNPFNPSTDINFFLPEKADVTMTVFDITGREVATLVNENLANGWHNVSWNAYNLSSGIYFYRINAVSNTVEFAKTMKMMLMK